MLKLRSNAPNQCVYFLLGEPPIEAKIHCDIYSLFYSLWCNKESKIHSVVKYLLQNIETKNSNTWSKYVLYLSKLYNTEDPLSCLNRNPPDKETYKAYYKTKIIKFHESEQRRNAKNNSCMKYLNVDLLGLSNKIHPIISNILTTSDMEQAIPHIKMLCMNYYTYEIKSRQKGGPDKCPRCGINSYHTDNLQHILTAHISKAGYNILCEIE